MASRPINYLDSTNGYPTISPHATTPYLTIIEQPVESTRYRFQVEITETSNGGALNNPKIRVESCGWPISGGRIYARLYTLDPINPPLQHINRLWGGRNTFLDQWTCYADIDRNNCATFNNLGILRVKLPDIPKELINLWIHQLQEQEGLGYTVPDTLKAELGARAEQERSFYAQKLQQVRIGFYGYIMDASTNRQIPLDLVFSNPIFNSDAHPELKIEECSISSGVCTGGTRIWLRCRRSLRKNDIKIVFDDPKVNWRREVVVNEIYSQFLVIFASPPYVDVNIRQSVTVNMRLFRSKDGKESEPIDFIYKPIREESLPAKRPRVAVESSFDVFPGSFYGPANGSSDGSNQSVSGTGYEYGNYDFNQYLNQNQARASDTGSFEIVRPYSDDSSFGGNSTRVSNVDEAAEQLRRSHLDDGNSSHKREDSTTDQNRPYSTDSGFVSNRSSIPADSVDSRVVSVNPLVTVIEKEESTLGETDETKKVAQMEQKLLKFTLSDLMKLSNAELVNVAMCLVGAQKAAVRNFSKEGDPVKFLEYIPRQIGSVDHSNGNSSLHNAVIFGQTLALHDLLKGLSLLESAEKSKIVNLQNNKKQTALHIAVYRDQVESVHYLLSAGADRSKCDGDGNTVAHYLSKATKDEIYAEILNPSSEGAKMFPLDLNVVNNDGYSAIHLAVMNIKLSLVENLLEAGANIEQQELKGGMRPLHLAVETGDIGVVECLLTKADPNSVAYDNRTPLHMAVMNKKYGIAAVLMQAEADPECQMVDETASSDMETEVESKETGATMEESSEVIMIDALRLAEGDQRMLKILTGQHKLEPEYEEFNSHHRCRVYSSPSSETLNEANWRNSAAGTSSGVVQHVPLGQKYSVGSRENSIPNDSDDVTSLDVVTRLRLSRLLDENRLWEKLATALGCGHMVEMLQCVTDSSPTSLLLDQYENLEGASISAVISALHKMGASEAEEVVKVRRQIRREFATVSPKELNRASM